MKTLDEVITVLDGCFLKSRKEWCVENCPYLQNDEQTCRRDVLNDALHYLKEYQTTQMAYIKAMADLEDNPPFTWDELKGMAGKPVWLEHPKTGEAHWAIIGNWYDESEMRLFLAEDENAYYVSRELYEEGILQAYRKERP